MAKNSITSVKVDKNLYDSFKSKNVNSRFYLQDLVNRCMYLYMHDAEFEKKIFEFSIPVLSSEAQAAILNISGSNTEVVYE
jgi:fructose-bisphosphate aldolase class 1